MIIGERGAFRAACLAVVGVLLPAHGVDSALSDVQTEPLGPRHGPSLPARGAPLVQKASWSISLEEARRPVGGRSVCSRGGFGGIDMAHGAFWVEMHLTVKVKPPLDTYAQVTNLLTAPLLHGHTLDGFSSQRSVPRRQTRPASCPHLLRVTSAVAISAHWDHISRAESAAAGRSLEMGSRLGPWRRGAVRLVT